MSANVRQTTNLNAPDQRSGPMRGVLVAVSLLFMLTVFLVAIRGLGQGFKGLGGDLLSQFFAFTENPFIGLVMGILATTLMQSSSVTTSMIVALVAAPDHALPVHHAIPMIMGANIGTTVTNSLVALGHIGRRIEFRRAFAAATCHDFFNFIAVAVFLPLELATGFLEKLSASIASMFHPSQAPVLKQAIALTCPIRSKPLPAASSIPYSIFYKAK